MKFPSVTQVGQTWKGLHSVFPFGICDIN